MRLAGSTCQCEHSSPLTLNEQWSRYLAHLLRVFLEVSRIDCLVGLHKCFIGSSSGEGRGVG